MKAIFLDNDGTLVDDMPFAAEPRRIRLVTHRHIAPADIDAAALGFQLAARALLD